MNSPAKSTSKNLIFPEFLDFHWKSSDFHDRFCEKAALAQRFFTFLGITGRTRNFTKSAALSVGPYMPLRNATFSGRVPGIAKNT